MTKFWMAARTARKMMRASASVFSKDASEDACFDHWEMGGGGGLGGVLPSLGWSVGLKSYPEGPEESEYCV